MTEALVCAPQNKKSNNQKAKIITLSICWSAVSIKATKHQWSGDCQECQESLCRWERVEAGNGVAVESLAERCGPCVRVREESCTALLSDPLPSNASPDWAPGSTAATNLQWSRTSQAEASSAQKRFCWKSVTVNQERITVRNALFQRNVLRYFFEREQKGSYKLM